LVARRGPLIRSIFWFSTGNVSGGTVYRIFLQAGYLFVREGKSKNARRHVSLTSRAQEMLVNRSLESKSEYVSQITLVNPIQ